MTAPLDLRAYEKDVVRPLRGAQDVLPGDLVTRYAVDVDMTAEDLRERVAEIVALWNSKARGTGPISAVYRAFQRAHDDLTSQQRVQLDAPEWWLKRAAEWAAFVETEVAVLADEVQQLYGSAGFVLPGQIAGLERLHPDLRGGGVKRALEQAGIPTVMPEELPQQSGLDRSRYERLTAALGEANAPTIFHLLHPGITEIRLFRSLHDRGAAPSRLDREILERRAKSVEAEANSSRSRATTLALGILRTAVDDGTDLRQLATFHILGKVRETRTAGQPPMLTVKSLIELGVAEPDARVLTASLLALEGASTSTSGPDDARRLVAAGQLAEARRVAAALPVSDAEANAAREIVARAEAEVNALIAAARAALANGDEAEASRRASAARAMASDDAAVVSFADSLPPPPPQGLIAVADGLDVKLSWQPVPGDEAAMRYRVVRRAGRAPIEPNDGDVITEGAASTARDTAALAAQPLVYAVFATADRRRWSRAATCTVEILPPVTEVTMKVTKDVVRCSWRAHPATTGVIVHRAKGRTLGGPHDADLVGTNAQGFADSDLAPDVTYCYAITAVYRDRLGQERRAEPVVVTTMLEQELKPIAWLRAEPIPGDHESLACVRLNWRQRDSADVRVLYARAACPWPYGATVPVGDVSSYGQEVTGEVVVRAGRAELTAELPCGYLFLTSFLFTSDTALVGQDVALGLTTPIGAVSHERRGPQLLLSWEWPARANAAELNWTGDDGTGQRRITRGERARDDGWARIPVQDGPMIVEIRAVEIGTAGEATSAPRVIRAAAADSRLSYDVLWKPVLPGMTARVGEVRVSTPEGCHQVTVVAVAKAGIARPAHPSDGEEVARQHVIVSADKQAVFPLNVSRKIRKPYWLCCFLADGSPGVLIDPPIKNMKVG